MAGGVIAMRGASHGSLTVIVNESIVLDYTDIIG